MISRKGFHRFIGLWLALYALCNVNAAVEARTAAVDSYYIRVVRNMNNLARPAAAKFHTEMTAKGSGVRLSDENGKASLLIGIGSAYKDHASWSTDFGESGEAKVIADGKPPLAADSPLFNPTWNGVYDWIRYGIDGAPQNKAVIAASPVPSPSANADSASGLASIGIVQAIGVAYYDVSDDGPATCPAGSVGEHYHLRAYANPEAHPVTDMTIDRALDRICAVKFNVGKSSALSLTGSYEIDFAEISGYWLVTKGHGDFLYRLFGFGAKRSSIDFSYSDFTISGSQGVK